MIASLQIAALAPLNLRCGISDAARSNIELMRGLGVQVDVTRTPSSELVYHHGMPPQTVQPWMHGRRVIGYWVCESSVANPAYREVMDAHAQIWTASEASAVALRAIGSQTPVFVIPHAVELPESQAVRRSRDTVTTLFAFAPPMERKNPEALIRTWRAAFPRDKSARLIIKTRNAPPSLTRLMELVSGGDERIEIINADLDDEQLTELYGRADIWLSMQRAGAFELHIAQAAAHGLAVITTDVGGPKDYLSTGAAVFIQGQEIPPLQECELNRCGVWYEPDQVAVIDALRTLAKSALLRKSMGDAARECIAQHLSPDRVQGLIREALEALPEPSTSTAASKPARIMPVHLRPLRSGLEQVGESRSNGTPVTPIVLSHRRSGTHLVGELIQRHWGKPAWLKSHAWPESLPVGHPRLYVLRNPVDTLHSCWRWWTSNSGDMTGGAMNTAIAEGMDGYSFTDFLNGRCGPRFGFNSMADGTRDNFETGRGMFYDPIAFWADHWAAAMDAGMHVLLYEDLLSATRIKVAEEVMTDALGSSPAVPISVLTQDVGLSPSGDHRVGKAIEEWPGGPLARLRQTVKPMLESIGRASLEEWITP